jgi:hypothetical protein
VIPLVGEMGEAQKGCRRAKVAVVLRTPLQLSTFNIKNLA